MKRTRRREWEESRLDMTPMIDCVFLLLVFFIATMEYEDIIAGLDVNRPSPDPTIEKQEKFDEMVSIGIFVDGVTINDKPIGMEALERMLLRLATYSKTQTILIKCAPDSPHDRLVRVLDLCAKAGLTNLSVFSM